MSAYMGKHMFVCLFFLPSSLVSIIWTDDVKSPAFSLQGNYSTAGDEEPALQPRYRGLFIRTPPNQHTDYSSDWDQKKPVFDTSLLVLALPSGLRLPLLLISGRISPVAHLMGLANSRNRAVSLQIFHLLPPPLIRCGCTDTPVPTTIRFTEETQLVFSWLFFPKFSSTLTFWAVVIICVIIWVEDNFPSFVRVESRVFIL